MSTTKKKALTKRRSSKSVTFNNFDDWFRAQFGSRNKDSTKSDEALRSVAYMGRVAQMELDRREAYDSKEHAALSAWITRSRINPLRRPTQ